MAAEVIADLSKTLREGLPIDMCRGVHLLQIPGDSTPPLPSRRSTSPRPTGGVAHEIPRSSPVLRGRLTIRQRVDGTLVDPDGLP